jgi:hypothetical protein
MLQISVANAQPFSDFYGASGALGPKEPTTVRDSQITPRDRKANNTIFTLDNYGYRT